ncbi:uncharacterized protein K02A2.6-like isoform X2 [Anopheles stephensi]|uniref:uncharacterized protein K02A2.6-like isoform X2 n=1 Tax=Anopheles stephensi TaxID=30069 RepID=UPI001658C0BF|nr:uncharacterized protein K02A2.6-like isoform X2 [Anopheles stephensi]
MEEEQRRLSQQFETPGTALLQPGYGQPLPPNAPAVEQQGSQASSVHFSPSLSSAPTSLHPPSLAPAASMQHPPSLPGVSQNGEPTMYQIMQLLRQLMTKIEQQPPASLPTNASQQQLPVVHPPSASQQQPLVSEIASQPQQQHRSAPANPEQILDSLARNITEFRFEAEAGLTFEAWYSRYEDLFVSDAARIDDAAKVRMLMRKLGSMEHEREVAAATKKDPLLREVYRYVQSGWPGKVSYGAELAQFHNRREALTTVGDCILFGERIVIPAALQQRCLRQLHQGHPGIQRMKAIARSFVYWPSLDSDIADRVASCEACQAAAKSPPSQIPSCWPKPPGPWHRVHIDYAGPVEGAYFLIAVDAYSKWPEIIKTASITSFATISILRGIFARFGPPVTLVSDNGTQFSSEAFKEFCECNGIDHVRTPPFHPQSNGQAERFVDTFKRSLKKIRARNVSLEEALDLFLLTYRSTPNPALDQRTPAEVMFGRTTRTIHHLLRPPAASESTAKDDFRECQPGDLVYAKVYRANSWNWIAGRIARRIGNVMYEVVSHDQRRLRRHVNQLRRRVASSSERNEMDQHQFPLSLLLDEMSLTSRQQSPSASLPTEPASSSAAPALTGVQRAPASSPASSVQPEVQRAASSSGSSNTQQTQLPRRSSRTRRLPRRFSAYRLN